MGGTYRTVRFPERAFSTERRADGALIVTSGLTEPGPFKPLTSLIDQWASIRPNVTAFSERTPDGRRRRITYSDLAEAVAGVASLLSAQGFGPGRSIMIAAPNSIDVVVVTYAALSIGAPVAPLSPMAFTPAADPQRAMAAMKLAKPAMLILLGRPAADIVPPHGVAVHIDGGSTLVEKGRRTPPPTQKAPVTQDTLGKIMFTSGSAGLPKAAPQTHGMLEAARHMTAIMGSPIGDGPPDYVEWMPWSHVMGGNISLHRSLTFGGTFHIDAGKPMPGRFDETLANLTEFAPSSYTSVPVGFAMLIPALERDHGFARHFFSRLWQMTFGGAAMPADIFARYNTLTETLFGERIAFCAGYGATETCGPAISQYWAAEASDLLGLPLAGMSMKLAPVGDRFELRIKGANVFTGYIDDDRPEERFDEDGFFRTGDAVAFEQDDIAAGVRFAGRLSENFKLSSGTWVQTGPLRLRILEALTPIALDAVVCGEGRDDVRALVWPRRAGIEEIFGGAVGSEIQQSAQVRAFVAKRLAMMARDQGSSARVTAIRFLESPPSARDGEINDKGYINQRRCLETRAVDVDALYRDNTAHAAA